VDVVHGVDLVLPPARVTVLVGPNGSGKSTLLKSIARLHPISAGEVRVGGEDARALSGRELARRLAMLTQGRPTPVGLTVREVVSFGRYPHRGRWNRSDPQGQAAIARALALTELAELADRDADTLSGGQAQRVWLAACLAQDTEVLLLDEPTTYLDLRHQVDLLDLVRDLADHHGITVGVVLHDLDQAAALADHLVLLDAGRVVAAGPPERVLEAPRLSAVYGLPIHVTQDPTTGLLRVTPAPRRR
jgi:iron complex transport system ATP-binding protein